MTTLYDRRTMTDKIPDAKKAKAGLSVAKAAVSAVPIVGGPLAELLNLAILPQIDKRREDWLNSLAERLQKLEERDDGFQMAVLADHPAFTSAMLQASAIALRNHDEEKLEALRNAVLTVAVSSTAGEDEHERFISLVDTCGAWHLRILAFLANKQGIAEKRGAPPFPSWSAGGASTVLEHVYPELVGRRDFYDLIVSDLSRAGLTTTDTLHVMGTAGGLMLAKQSSDMGDRFIRFISESDA